jgi:dipeptidyl aminopeptidase/acylaminoacyl peptidase
MGDLPTDTVEEAERLTRLARRAVDDNEAAAYRQERDALLAEHGYTARVRTDDRDTLVCYPEEWVDADGNVHPERIDDIDRGVERPLEGPGEAEDWDGVADHNDELVAAVAADHDGVHRENARALADFASNHYAKPIDDLTREELREFRDDYFVRNAFPSDEQERRLSESIRLVFGKTGVECPLS